MRSEREAKLSDANKPVIGLRPLKERNKRSEAMIEEQVDKLKKKKDSNVLDWHGGKFLYLNNVWFNFLRAVAGRVFWAVVCRWNCRVLFICNTALDCFVFSIVYRT